MEFNIQLLFTVIPMIINVILSGIVIYKFFFQSSKEKKFLKQVKEVLDYMKSQEKFKNLSKYIETTLNVVFSGKDLTAQQVENVVSFVKQTMGI